jgi:hypothetical protein
MKRRSWWLMLFAPQAVAQQVIDRTPVTGVDSRSVKLELGAGQEDLRMVQAMSKLQDDQHKLLAVQSKIAEVLASQQNMIDAINRDIHAKPKPLNNQCPVCGTMAPARIDQKVRDASGMPLTIRIPGGGEVQRWVARCAHCNAAFWQDAEVVK